MIRTLRRALPAAAVLLAVTACTAQEPANEEEPTAAPQADSVDDILAEMQIDDQPLVVSDSQSDDEEGLASAVDPAECAPAAFPRLEPSSQGSNALAVAATETAEYSVTVVRNDPDELRDQVTELLGDVEDCGSFTFEVEDETAEFDIEVGESGDDAGDWIVSDGADPNIAYAVAVTDHGAIVASTNYQATGEYEEGLVAPTEVLEQVEQALSDSSVPPLD